MIDKLEYHQTIMVNI